MMAPQLARHVEVSGKWGSTTLCQRLSPPRRTGRLISLRLHHSAPRRIAMRVARPATCPPRLLAH